MAYRLIEFSTDSMWTGYPWYVMRTWKNKDEALEDMVTNISECFPNEIDTGTDCGNFFDLQVGTEEGADRELVERMAGEYIREKGFDGMRDFLDQIWRSDDGGYGDWVFSAIIEPNDVAKLMEIVDKFSKHGMFRNL